MSPSIIWLNGTFGVGKTTTAHELVQLVPGTRTFDPEYVGFMLRHFIAEPVGDFQDWPAWRALVAETVVQLNAHYGGTLVAPMTLLSRDYAEEIFSAVAARGLGVRHVLLHADEVELERRIETDEVEKGARTWRLDHLPGYRDALPWLRESATVVDTTDSAPADVAQKIAALL